jgi:exopolyphosphatase/guanosine-5'-triphosphate,3'-diphosphate pyrophosphatase
MPLQQSQTAHAITKTVKRPGRYFAALDLGSNTCRILIARAMGESYKVVDSFSRVIRLGTGVRSTGVLSKDAMDRAIEALKECARKLDKYQIFHIRSVATEACRQAQNREEFITRVKMETGIALEVINEEEEARLALKGCIGLINPKYPYILAFDIGGCSTEVMWATTESGTPQVLNWLSLPYGVVSVLESCCGDAAPFYDDIRNKISSELQALEESADITRHIAEGKVQMIGSSGTTTTVAAIQQSLTHYDRTRVDGCALQTASIHKIGNEIRLMDTHERSSHPCIGPERCDLVLGGLAILEGICDTWPIESLYVADRGVRDGILADMMARPLQVKVPA